jgi:hypothetical protein
MPIIQYKFEASAECAFYQLQLISVCEQLKRSGAGQDTARYDRFARRPDMKAIALAVALVVLLLVTPAVAQFYRYVDAGGHVRFTDDINQVPEKQRAAARKYVESRTVSAEPAETLATAPGSPAGAAPAPAAGDPPAEMKDRMEDLKKQVDAQYQALVKQKEELSKEKDTTKTRQQVMEYNKRVEAFNQAAGDYEARSGELRKTLEDYNARVLEENAKAAKPAPK